MHIYTEALSILSLPPDDEIDDAPAGGGDPSSAWKYSEPVVMRAGSWGMQQAYSYTKTMEVNYTCLDGSWSLRIRR
jgi:hypothetical protein